MKAESSEDWLFPRFLSHILGFILLAGSIFLSQNSLSQVPGTKLWEVTLGNHVFSSPAIGADGTIYVGISTGFFDSISTNGWLYAISPQGATNWAARVFGDIRGSPAIGPEGNIYVGSVLGYLYAFNADGTTNWQLATSRLATLHYYSFIGGSPAIGSDGTVYVNSRSGYDPAFAYRDQLYAVSPTGTTKWVLSLSWLSSHSVDDVLVGSPTIGPDGTIYVTTRDKRLFAINPNGTTNWVMSIGAEARSSPAIGSDGTIYIGADDHKVYAIDPRGFEKWAFLAGDLVECSAAIFGSRIFLGSWDRKFYALDASGTQIWAATNPVVSASPVLAADGSVYVLDVGGKLSAIDPSGSYTWSFTPVVSDVCVSSPVIGSDGTIYFGAGRKLYAVSGTNSLMNSCWPMFRGDVRHTGRSLQRAIQKPAVLADGNIGMSLTVETGRTYQVEYSTNLFAWSELTNFVSTIFTNRFIDITATNSTSRFYRLRTEAPR